MTTRILPPAKNVRNVDRDSRLDDALHFAAIGCRVVPVDCCGRPLVAAWKHAATKEPARIRESWMRWPDARVAVVTGRSSVVVLRVHGELGNCALAKLEREFAALPQTPELRCIEAGKVDRFLFFQGTRLMARRELGPGLTIYADGSLLLMPPILRAEAI